MPYTDREKQRAYQRSHYRTNQAKYRDARAASRERRRALVIEAKSQPCADCGVTYPYYVMDFDHMGDKSAEINELWKRCGVDELMAEIAKCEVVCSNCHRRRSWERSGTKNGP